MKKRLLILVLLCVLLAGCGKKDLFPFTLPEGMSLENVTQAQCHLASEGQVVGGFRRTDLGVDIFTQVDKSAVVAYMDSLEGDPYVMDYMMGQGQGASLIDFSRIEVNPGTMEIREYMHYLFEKDGICMDLWLDPTAISPEQRLELLEAIGIA